MKKRLLSALLLIAPPMVIGGTYIVPKEYDNVYISNKSVNNVLISNLSTTFSAPRTFAGRTLSFRCVLVPKIDCRAATADINVNISSVSLKDPSASALLVDASAQDTAVEDAGTQWRVCAAAYGGLSWDDTSLAYNAATETLTYTYNHDTQGEFFYFLTNANTLGLNVGHATSYIEVETKQTCR